MTKNRKLGKPKREMSHRQLANWQKQARGQRLVLFISIGVVAAVLLVIGAGWYLTEYQPRHQKVLVVNGTVFRMDYYLKALKYYSGDDTAKLDKASPSIISSIEQAQLVREGAGKLGISVADNETDAVLKNNNLKEDYRDLVGAELLAQNVFDHFKAETATSAEYRHLNALFVESESKAQEVLKDIETSDNFTGIAEQVSVDSYTRQQSGDLGFQMKEILALPSYLGTSAVGDFAFNATADNTTISIVKDDAKKKSLGYWLIKVTDRQVITDNTTATADNTTISDNQTPTTRVRISAILLGNRDEAENVKARLDSGEDFAALAKELSQDNTSRDQDGDLGWFGKDTIKPAFDTFAFDPAVPLGKVSDALSDNATMTTGGYWLVKVVAADPGRQVADNDRNLLASAAFNDWLTALRTNPDNKIDVLLTEKQRVWAVDTARKELSE